MKASSVISSQCLLGEGPVWHQNRLWWVDIEGKCLFSWQPGEADPNRYDMPERIGFAVPTSGPQWALGLQSGIYLWHPETKAMELLQAPDRDLSYMRFNDGKCDPQGRLWAGTMHLQATVGAAALYRLSGRSNCRKMLSQITISNGLAWDIRKKAMYYIDTKTTEVASFAFDPESGDIANRRTVISIPPETGAPDGMTIDSEGMLWIALWGGYGVIRVNPVDGTILTKIDVPAPNVTSCTFGCDALDTLYITTARIGMNDEQLAEFPESGNIFSVKPGISGLPVTPFNL